MDKVELSKADLDELLEWRDEHKDLVRELPAPLKSVEIVFKHNDYRIKGIRKNEKLRICVSKGFENLGNAELEIDIFGRLVHKKGKMKMTQDSFQSCLTVYCSLMALMVYSGIDGEVAAAPAREKSHSIMQKRQESKDPKRITYIIKMKSGKPYVAPVGSHAKPTGIFSVRGHYRHYKNGKVIWIAEYKKGTGKAKRKTYKLKSQSDDGR